jgi:hypothetical protein
MAPIDTTINNATPRRRRLRHGFANGDTSPALTRRLASAVAAVLNVLQCYWLEYLLLAGEISFHGRKPEDVCAAAAKGGHLEVLQWLRGNGCEWDAFTRVTAAGGDHLHVLKWARANGCPWDSRTCHWAALEHVEVGTTRANEVGFVVILSLICTE